MQTGPDKNLGWEKSLSADGEVVSQPGVWIPRSPGNSCKEGARRGCSGGSVVVILNGEFLVWTTLNCSWNTPASPQTGIFEINLKSKAWKPNSSSGEASDPPVLALLSLPRTWKNTLRVRKHLFLSPRGLTPLQDPNLLCSGLGANPAFPRAGNKLGTCKSIMDAENSQLQVPGSSGCTCTVSQVPWKRDGRDACCPQGSLPKMGFSCLFYTVLLCLRFGSRFLQPGSQRGWKSPG